MLRRPIFAVGASEHLQVCGRTVGGTLKLRYSLISGNTASVGGEIANRHISDMTTAYNLVGHQELTNAEAFANFTPGASDLTATSDGTTPTALTDILDMTLRDNGGPTDTHNLVPGSPAIDAVLAGCPPPEEDQRGVARPQGAACDIGAVEFISEAALNEEGGGR